MTDATTMLKELAEPWRPGEFVKDAISRIAPLAGLSQSRAGDIWYGKARRVEGDELAKIADALSKKNARSVWNRIHKIEVELAQLRSIVAASNADYGQSDPDIGGDRYRLARQDNRSGAGGR
jgi:hypothetical protein